MSHVSDESQVLVSMRPPTGRQVRLALAVGLAFLGLFLAAVPFADMPLPRIAALGPTIATTVIVADTITSALLLAQFAVLRRPALLALATGYLFSGLMVLAYGLASPGVFGRPALLGGGPLSSGWLFTILHVGVPTTILSYALIKDGNPPGQIARGAVRRAILVSIIGALCLAIALAWLVIAHHDVLSSEVPPEISTNPYLGMPTALAIALICACTMAVLWTRRRSQLDMWLLLVTWARLLEAVLLLGVNRRFDVDWYATRALGLVSTTILLGVLLSEMTTIYARLALSVMMRRREREGRLMTLDVVGASIEHEVRQPLAAIIQNGSTALRWLAAKTPDVARAAEVLQAMVDDGHRAGRVIARVRGMFSRDESVGGSLDLLDINEVVEEVLVLVRGELRRHGIIVEGALDPRLPAGHADKAQLQQVLLNLIANAIEAMDRGTGGPRVLRIHTGRAEREILVTVEDTGPGIDAKDSESIFDPMFTTKSRGTGLGLAICRSIIDAHGGRMWAAPGAAGGTAIGLTLPFADVPSADRDGRAAQPRAASRAETAIAPPVSGGRARSVAQGSAAPHPAARTRTEASAGAAEVSTAARIRAESPMLLATLSPSSGQRRLAVLAALVLLGASVATLPFSHIRLERVEVYIPVASTVIFINDTITSAMLFAQFAVLRTFALLVLAAGHLLTGLLVVAWLLAFPGAIAPTGVLGGGPQSPPWLYLFWTLALLAGVTAYALLKEEPARRVRYGAERAAILVSIAAVLCVVAGLIWLATADRGILPPVVRYVPLFGAQFNALWRVIGPGSALLGVLVMAFLWMRMRSLLDLWLLVVMWAWLMKSTFAALIMYRYDVAWYANVAFALVSATFVLLVLLSETTKMYARLALSVMAERREHGERLMTMDAVAASIAHEINQPLAAIVNNGSAALRWLARGPPNVAKASEALRAMIADGRRASDVVGGIRTTLRRDEPEKESLDINAVVEEVLALVRDELAGRDIAVRTALDPRLPLLKGNKVQLQQVLLNLIGNAMEAMARTGARPGLLRARTVRRGREALVTVEDNGAGIDPGDIEHVFDPFFTTKARGTGLGLAICRSIVEGHGGRIWAVPGLASGTVFHFTLPLTPAPGMARGRPRSADA